MSSSRLDETIVFEPLGIAVLTVSDTRDASNDTSGDTLAERIEGAGHVLKARAIVKDKKKKIARHVIEWAATDGIDVVITTGGTGLTGRDVTVEALKPLFDKEIDGFASVFHLISFAKIGTSTIQSRACAGIIDGTLVFCLPGSTGAVKDGWDDVLKWQLDNRHKPCNFAEIMPRLLET